MEIGLYTLDELHKMLDSAKGLKAAQPLIPLINTAIDAEEQRIKNAARDASLREQRPRYRIQEIVIRAMAIATWSKDRHCQGSYHPEGDHFIFEMEQTKRWFSQDSFLPRVGYLLIPTDTHQQYVITKIDFLGKRPKKSIFTAVPYVAA